MRKYKDEPIPEEILVILRDRIREINEKAGLHIHLVTGEPKAFSGLMAYDSFSGVKNYLVMVRKKGDEAQRDSPGSWSLKKVIENDARSYQ